MGVIKTHKTIDPDCDSLFTLGSITGNQPLILFIQPVKFLNAARFINGKSKKVRANCASAKGLLEKEIYICIYSIKQINEGEELIYPYLEGYFFDNDE